MLRLVLHQVSCSLYGARARHCPQAPNMIATKTVSGIVNVYDLDKHDAVPSSSKPAAPEMELHGHTKEGCHQLLKWLLGMD